MLHHCVILMLVSLKIVLLTNCYFQVTICASKVNFLYPQILLSNNSYYFSSYLYAIDGGSCSSSVLIQYTSVQLCDYLQISFVVYL